LNTAGSKTLGTTKQLVARAWNRSSLAREIILALPALVAAFLVAFRDFLAGNRSIATFQDNTYLILPLFHHISQSFSRGDYPYWMNTIVGGLPLYNVPQFSTTYPFYFFRSGLYVTALDSLFQVHNLTLLHLFILYLNTYVLLRVLRLAPLPSFLGASLFAFSANTFDYTVWINTIAPYSWFPLVVASVVLILENRHAKVGILLGAASFGLLILASPAQPLIHALFSLGCIYMAHVIRCLKNRDWRTILKTTRNLIIMGVLAVMLGAPSLFPALADNDGMIRFLGNYPPVVGFAKIPFNAFLTGQLRPIELAGTLLPLNVHRIIGNSFVGMSAVLLAMFAIFKTRSNWIVASFFFIALYGLLSSTGSYLGMASVNYYLPLINRIREPPRHLFLFTFAVSILAAYGFTYLTEALNRGYGELLNWRSLALLTAFAVLLALTLKANLAYTGAIPKTLSIMVFAAVVFLLLLQPLLPGVAKKVGGVLAVLLVVYGNQQYPLYVPRLNDGDYFSSSNLMSHRTLEELSKLPEARTYRFIFADDKLPSMFWSMNASYYGLRSFQGYMNPLPDAQFREIFQRFDLHNYYPMLGAKYYLCNPCDEKLLHDYKFVREINGYRLNVADQALPRYTVINKVGGTYGSPEDFYNKIHTGFDFAREIYLNENDGTRISNWLGGQDAPPAYILKEEDSSLNRLRLSVNTEARAIFILNEYYNKAWKAHVNGVAVKTFNVNLNQVGILLDSGNNLVDFEYYPTVFVRWLWLQRITFIGISLYVIYLIVQSGHSMLQRRKETEQATPL
jgi:hypothetical protein